MESEQVVAMTPEEVAFVSYTKANKRLGLSTKLEGERRERYIAGWRKERERKEPPTKAEIYLIRCDCPGNETLFKIGVTTRGVEARIKDLITGSPFNLVQVFAVAVEPDYDSRSVCYTGPLF